MDKTATDDVCIRLQANFLGKYSLLGPDGRELMPISKKKDSAVLAYMVWHAGQPIPRSSLVDLCWSESGKPQGKDSHRQAIRSIKKALGPEYSAFLQLDRLSVTFLADGDRLRRDYDDAFDTVMLDQSLTLLDGLENVSAVFDDWLSNRRKEIAQAQIGLAERQIHAEQEGSPDALAMAHHILAIDPIHEGAVRTAMIAHAKAGELPRAQQLFQDLEKRVKAREFSVSQKTREVLAQLHEQNPTASHKLLARYPGGPASTVNGNGMPAIQVTALTPLDILPDMARAVSLLNEDLAARLSQVREFKTVLGDAPSEAEYELGGHIADERGALKVSVHVTSRQSGERIWSHMCEIPFAKQTDHSEFVETVVGGLVGEIERDQRSRLKVEDRQNWTAYQWYLGGKAAIIYAKDADYLLEAEPCFERAIELDEDFVPAYPALIASYNSSRRHTSPGQDWREGNDRAMKLLRELLMHDAQYPNAHISKAWCLMRRRQFDLAEQSLEAAVRLKPYEPARLNAIGTAYVYLGDLDRAETFYDTAERRMVHDMDYMMTDRGELHYFRRDYETALTFLDIGEISNPLQPKCFRCATLAQLGRLSEAQQEAKEVIELFRERWTGKEEFSPREGLLWYLKGFTFRRTIDFDNLVEGLTKAGLIL